MSFSVEWTNHALKDLNEFEITFQKRIVRKVDEFANSGVFHGVKRMQGHEKIYRLRAGDYRVIFELNNNLIIILKIGHRKNIY